MPVPNIGKVRLAENWWSIFTGECSLVSGNPRMFLKANFEDGSTEIWECLKCDVENGIPYCIWDIRPSKNVRYLIVAIGTHRNSVCSFLMLEPPSGQKIMQKGVKYTFKLFLSLKEPTIA